MKEYEIYSNLKISQCSRVLLRLDGRSFHSLSKHLNLEKPYDTRFAKVMSEVCKDILLEFSPSFIYTFSDEISVLLSTVPFGGRVEKLDSVFSSFVSSSFTAHLLKEFNINFNGFNSESSNFNRYANMLNIDSEDEDSLSLSKPISFDSRIIPIDDSNLVKYFKWRQDEAWRNCVNAYGIWALKENYPPDVAAEKMFGLKSSDVHDLLFEQGINLNDLPAWKKRGLAVYKNIKTIKSFNSKTNKEEISYMKYPFIDFNIPKFDMEFFKKKQILE